MQESTCVRVILRQKILQLPASGAFKSGTGMLPELMNDIFHFVESSYIVPTNFTLWKKWDFTAYQYSDSLCFQTPKLRILFQNFIENSASL